MTQVNWSDLFRLGIPRIDDDHERLLALLEGVLEAVAAGEAADVIIGRLDVLATETEAHFAREEDLLDRANYPGLVAHRAEHDRLLSHLRHMRQILLDGLPAEDDGSRTAMVLRDWLLQHIREDDAAYKPSVLRLV
jgi:hemerythrin